MTSRINSRKLSSWT